MSQRRAVTCRTAAAGALLALASLALSCSDRGERSDGTLPAALAEEAAAPPAYSLEETPNRKSITAHNGAQGFVVELRAGKLQLSGENSPRPWSFEMEWTGYGRGDDLGPVPEPASRASVERNRASLRRGAVLTEWYVNAPAGLEQGFVLAEPPASRTVDAPITIELQIRGDVELTASAAGTSVSVRPPGSTSRLSYAKLAVRDAHGRCVPAWMSALDTAIRLHADDRGARYPLHVDPLFTVEAKLTDSGPAQDEFGRSVAMSGSTAMVSAELNDDVGANTGAVYVFQRDGVNWPEQPRIYASDAAGGDRFGRSIALEGDVAVVGAIGADVAASSSGKAYVFVRSASAWSEQATLVPSDGAQQDEFGTRVALHDDTVVVGVPLRDLGIPGTNENHGAAYVFVRSASTWSEQQRLEASDFDQSDHFGDAVAIHGDTAVIGAPDYDLAQGNDGAAYVFTRAATTWSEHQLLTDSQPMSSEHFGSAVSLEGDTLLVGARFDRTLSGATGSVFVFTRSGASWSEQERLVATDGEPNEQFGCAVALLGDVAVVGASSDFFGSFSDRYGSAYVFIRSGSTWTENQKLVASDGENNDDFGTSVAVSPGAALVGAPRESDYQGAAYAYAAVQQVGAECTEDAHCLSGYCVDAVCCDVPCGGDDPDDCLVCSVAAGATLDGECAQLPDGTSCDDRLFCTGVDTCAAGACVGPGDPCPGSDGDANCHETCDEVADDCEAYDGEGAPCDDDVFCNGVGHCVAGGCSNSTESPCPGPDGDADCNETCDEQARGCSAYDGDGAACLGGLCQNGTCQAGLGSFCTDNGDCLEGHCVDHVCCTAPTCGPYRCGPDGSCVNRCYTTADCAEGYQCTADGTCRRAESATDDGGACGCMLPGRARHGAAWLAALTLGAAAGLRCRRTRRAKTHGAAKRW